MNTLRYEVRSGSRHERYVRSVHRSLARALDDLSNHGDDARVVVRGSVDDLAKLGVYVARGRLCVDLVSGTYEAEIQLGIECDLDEDCTCPPTLRNT